MFSTESYTKNKAHTGSMRVSAMQSSLIRQVFDRKRPTSINLGLGQPSENVPSEILEEGIRQLRGSDLGYTPNAGMLSLRDKIAKYHNIPHAKAAQNVVITCGAQEAILAVMGVCLDVGDEVIVPDPGFPGYAMAAQFLGAHVVVAPRLEAEQFCLKTSLLEERITPRTRLVVLNSPANPTGKIDAKIELDKLAALAYHHQFWILCDEIYSEILYTTEPMPSVTQFCDRAILVSGLSKSVAMTGFRLGYAIAPDALSANLIRSHAVLTSCAPTLSQHMAHAVFQNPHLLKSHFALYTDRRTRALAALEKHIPNAQFIIPDGAFYIMLNCSEFFQNSLDSVNSLNSLDSLDLALKILNEKDVLTTPGLAFGQTTQNWLRLSFAGNPCDFDEGIRRIGEWICKNNHKSG